VNFKSVKALSQLSVVTWLHNAIAREPQLRGMYARWQPKLAAWRATLVIWSAVESALANSDTL
jgi:hypothetical protein